MPLFKPAYCVFFLWILTIRLSLCDYSEIAVISATESAGVYNFEYFNSNYLKSKFKFIFVSGAYFEETIKSTGWSALSVTSSAIFPDIYQAYWSGYLEGNLTRKLIDASWSNSYEDMCPLPLSRDCAALKDYLYSNLDYAIETAISQGSVDSFWHMVELNLWQLKGVLDAYAGRFLANSSYITQNYLRTVKDDVFGIYLLQLGGDLSEIVNALRLDSLFTRKNKFGTPMFAKPSCSALIKFTANDVFLSHVTWSPYSQMLRVLKHYNFPWNTLSAGGTTIPGKKLTFSSYPSVLFSIDDFYITSSKLVVIETTIGNSNQSLWQLVRNGARSSLLSPLRIMAANRLATSGSEWVEHFKKNNSGTYNNQWMVFDAKRYSPGKAIRGKGILTIAEQIPGLVFHEDVTDVLTKQTYWPSYNLPYFPLIYNMSGVWEKKQAHGDWYDYEKTARAQMFRQMHHQVTDLPSMYRLMRYNDFKHDPLSRCNCIPPYTGENAISARCDLNPPNGTYAMPQFGYRLHGGTDVKLVNYNLISTMNMVATSGPTYSSLPPFQWSKLPVPVPRPKLHPDKWMFKPILTNFTDFQVAQRVQIAVF